VPLRSTRIVPGGTRREDPRLTVKDLAEFIEVGENMVREACRTGKLRCIKKPNGEYSLTVPDVLAWLKAIAYQDADRLAYLERIAARMPTAAA
jgi:hypothetical protein